ncbi:MAG: TIGR02584 family CRISPR-associated protein [Thiobacillus sp.]|nr:TIGR02584 family CRISPR-associated protein [Thiobacillus sp.]
MGIRHAPEDFQRKILLAVIGLSPQILTETVYALAVKGRPAFVPDEVHVVTTGEGAEYARHTLLDSGMGRFGEMLRDYSLQGRVRFDADCIHVISRPDGQTASDIQSPEDNMLAADNILKWVNHFTRDDNVALHVSIAGGRKTMGFFAGYALSLFGRTQDRLSHVLVSDPFESNHDFYYPPPTPKVLFDRNNKPIHTSDANVMLAEIPFVRLRHGLPDSLVEGSASFSEVVAAAQHGLAPVSLRVDPLNRTLNCGNIEIRMEPAPFAFYYWLAKRAQSGLPPVRYDQPDVVDAFLSAYAEILNNPDSSRLENARQALMRRSCEPASRRPTSIRTYFDPIKAKANAALERALGEEAAIPYQIQSIGDRMAMRFGLMGLQAQNITVGNRPPREVGKDNDAMHTTAES